MPNDIMCSLYQSQLTVVPGCVASYMNKEQKQKMEYDFTNEYHVVSLTWRTCCHLWVFKGFKYFLPPRVIHLGLMSFND